MHMHESSKSRVWFAKAFSANAVARPCLCEDEDVVFHPVEVVAEVLQLPVDLRGMFPSLNFAIAPYSHFQL